MKYKVGDKVRIVPLKVLKRNPGANSEGLMNKYCGKIAEVTAITYNGAYRLDIDSGDRNGLGWCWYEDMLEDVNANAEKLNLDNEVKRMIQVHPLMRDLLAFPDFFINGGIISEYNPFLKDKNKHPINLIGEHKFLTLKIRS